MEMLDTKILYQTLIVLCYLAFVLRVLAQVFVALYAPPWLPSMPQWYSGLMPYGQLLVSQFIIMIFLALVTYDYLRLEGMFFIESATKSRFFMAAAILYFSSMVIRLVITKWRNPGVRYPRGVIPICFHCILACLIFLCAHFPSL